MPDQTLTPQQQFLQELKTGCHAYNDQYNTSYGYVPSLPAGIAFLALFGLSMVVHTVQSVWKRTWWSLVFSLGCLSTSLLLSVSLMDNRISTRLMTMHGQ